ncbi:MAG: hypothetical protein M1827_000648 [Pycnora praestabilis]|nr:MAG: hypothetical protein M1827_000648 [Pycnora praestabilis]
MNIEKQIKEAPVNDGANEESHRIINAEKASGDFQGTTTDGELEHEDTIPYKSYFEYIDALARPEHYGIWQWLRRAQNRKRPDLQANCWVIDALPDGTLSTSFEESAGGGDEGWHSWDADMYCRLGKILKTPSAGSKVRMILVETKKHMEITAFPPLMDLIGLGHDIEPLFFWSHIQRFIAGDPECGSGWWSFGGGESWEKTNMYNHDLLHLIPRYCILGGTIITFARAVSGEADGLPVVVMLRRQERMTTRYPGLEVNDPPTLRGQQKFRIPKLLRAFIGWPEAYFALLNHLIDNQKQSAPVSHNPVSFLYPVLRLQISSLLEMTTAARGKYVSRWRQWKEFRDTLNDFVEKPTDGDEDDDEEKTTSMHDTWSDLRRSIEDIVQSHEYFLRFVDAQFQSVTDPSSALTEEIYLKISQDREFVLQQARRVEIEIRDFLQLEVGRLSLEESKKSIEQSQIAIDEGKRGNTVKLITILAFIFIPLNLATSIFGMNIQELNGSGKRLWSFFVTAIAISFLTFNFWFVSYVAVRWRRNVPHREFENKTLTQRLQKIWELFTGGNTWWMLRSGVFVGLLTYGHLGCETPCAESLKGLR